MITQYAPQYYDEMIADLGQAKAVLLNLHDDFILLGCAGLDRVWSIPPHVLALIVRTAVKQGKNPATFQAAIQHYAENGGFGRWLATVEMSGVKRQFHIDEVSELQEIIEQGTAWGPGYVANIHLDYLLA